MPLRTPEETFPSGWSAGGSSAKWRTPARP